MKPDVKAASRVVKKATEQVRSVELNILVSVLLVIGSLWAFAETADEVLEGATASVDEALLLSMRNPSDISDPLGPRWVEDAVRDLTSLGGYPILILLVATVCGHLIALKKGRRARFVLFTVLLGWLLSSTLKEVFERPRPSLVAHGAYVSSLSFPSGHSMMSAVTYLTLASLLSPLFERRLVKSYLFFCAILLTVIVGASRVYLGVHWPSDVLAGWLAGVCWALFCSLIGSLMQRRGQL